MTSAENVFVNLTRNKGGEVSFGDNQKGQIYHGYGTRGWDMST